MAVTKCNTHLFAMHSKNLPFNKLPVEQDLEAKLVEREKYSVGHFKTQIITTKELCSVKLPSGVV